MVSSHLIKVINMVLLLSVCTLAACGKIGPLYLPDEAPPQSETTQ